MPSYYHFKDTIAVGNVEVIVTVDDILGNLHEYYPLLDIGEISLGNDKDSDIIYYPSNFDLEVAITHSDLYYWSKAAYGISQFGNQVELLIDDVLKWRGYVYKKSIRANKIAKTLKFNCIDQSQSFKESIPSSNPLSYNLDNYYKVVDILNSIFTSTAFNSSPFITQTNYHGTIQARYGSPEAIYNFNDFYANAGFYFGADSNYENMMDLVKNILLNYNLIGYFGLDRVLHLIPRVYEGQTAYTILKTDLLKDPEFEMSYGMEGMQAKLWTGSYPKTDGGHFSTVNYGSIININDKEKVERIQIDQPGGVYPEAPDNSIAFSGVAVNYNGSLVFVDTNGNFRNKNIFGNYNNWDALWKIPVTTTWGYVLANRPQYKVEVSGIWDKWNFDKYYKFVGSSEVYRLVKTKYNLYKKRSTLTLKKAN